MKVVITGAAGYVGWSAVNALADDDRISELTVYDNFARRNYGLLLAEKRPTYRKINVIVDDILNSRGLKSAVQGADCVCHLAALAPSPYTDDKPHAFDQVNHWGTAEVCYAAEDAGVSRFVYVSSGAVYGFPGNVADVTTPPMPANAYGASKLAGERHVERLASLMDSVILRAGTVYGRNPVARFDTFMNRFVLDAVLGRPLHVHGSGEQVRPVVHVSSLGHAIRAAVAGDAVTGTHDVVEANVAVNDAVNALREHDLSAEVIHTNQQARLNDLRVEPTPRNGPLPRVRRDFNKELPAMLDCVRLA
ncbi:SDR family oxidoreductase [Arhodomonas aquaeolei]|uniref:NAD-dependent epimerase/dehydratase family protein n=1 Tax=Arhodomonas aquaeolei TaxID=2369 RepID=UPI0021694A5D|nr:SDR family oxidoreductase [Arhodomonas aquaeolei]MCS4502500.1 SDR family oxidoreductase [Arhodomonas aquaeolei]